MVFDQQIGLYYRMLMTETDNKANKNQLKLILVSIVLTTAIFAIDLAIPLGVAAGVHYMAVVLIGLLTTGKQIHLHCRNNWNNSHHYWLFSLSCRRRTLEGTPYRSIALFAIWAAALCLRQKRNDEPLKASKLTIQEYTRKLVSVQEVERKKIAIDLHEGIAQDLVVILN